MDENQEGEDGVLVAKVNIRDTIRDRKAERRLMADQKRQADLQRIRDMRSTTGIDPLKLFPKEIWLKIFEELGPEDRAKMWLLHPLFRDLMEGTRVRDILFPQVLPVHRLMESIAAGVRDDSNELLRKFRQLRCVSKDLRNSFDHLMEDNLTNDITTDEGIRYFNVSAFCLNVVKFRVGEREDEETLDRLLTNFQGGNCARRFFRRGISVVISEDTDPTLENVNEFRRKITTLLEIFGHQIWYFKCSMDDLGVEEYSFPQVYALLHEWASLMPNLKCLELNIGAFASDQQNQTEKTSAARGVVRENPFPRLESLEKIAFTICIPPDRRELFQMYEAILEANQHISILKLDLDDRDDSSACLPWLPVQVIQSLHLKNFRVSSRKVTLEAIQPLVNLNWQLKTINLRFEKSRSGSLESIFRFLEHFPTLENVVLRIPRKIRLGNGDTLGYLNLPNLSKFVMYLKNPKIDFESNIHFFFSLQFLLQCKKLKTLTWSMQDFDDDKLRMYLLRNECRWTKIDFRAGLRFLHESNIWNVFPSLELVQLFFVRDSVREDKTCDQEYNRKERGEDFSVGDFLQKHVCFHLNRLRYCVILFG